MSAVWNDEKVVRSRFSFLCNKEEGDLEQTEEEGVLYCQQCKENVHRVEEQEDLEINARLGRCVIVRTKNNAHLVAKPEQIRVLYLKLDEEHGGTEFGPYSFTKADPKVLMGTEAEKCHIYLPKVYGFAALEATITSKEGRFFLKPGSEERDVRVMRSGESVAMVVKKSTELFEGDQISLVADISPHFMLRVAWADKEPEKKDFLSHTMGRLEPTGAIPRQRPLYVRVFMWLYKKFY